MVDITNMAQEARKAATILAKANTQQKNQVLTVMAKLLLVQRSSQKFYLLSTMVGGTVQ